MKQIRIKCKLKEKQLQESLVKTQASLIEGGYSNLKDEPISDLDGDDGEYLVTLNVNKVDNKLIPILKELGEPESGTKYFDHDSEDDDSDNPEVVEGIVETKVEETTDDPDTIVPLLAIRYMCPKRELHSLVIKESESVDKLKELAEEGCVITYITSDIDKFNQEYNKGDMSKKVSKLDDLYFSKEEELGHTSSLKDLYFSEEELMEEDKTELHDETETKVEENVEDPKPEVKEEVKVEETKVEDPAPEVKEDPKQEEVKVEETKVEELVEDPKPEEKVEEVEETKTELHDETEDPEPEPEPEIVDEYKSPVEMLKESQEEFSEESLENFCKNQNNKFRK